MPSGVYPRNEMHIEICRRANLGRTPWNKGLKIPASILARMSPPPHFTGEKSSHWKHGLSKTRAYKRKMYRTWAKDNPEKIRLNKVRRAWLKRKAGVLSKATIQKVYEDNIKLFGTLTCVYCIKKILFGNDTIDHVFPLKRGGNHAEGNLVVACRRCNSFKKDKLYSEVI